MALLKIMLIDDSEIDLFVSRRILEIEGIAETITPMRSALSALEYLKTSDTSPDLILLDLKMPIMDGFDFLEQFCALRSASKANTKVILLSSSSSMADKTQALKYGKCGLVDYLNKPLSREKIVTLKEVCCDMQKAS
jgi:CheY-like chemotaxis protein